MEKIWVIAAREYRAMVATKAFMLSIAMMPILMFGSIIAVSLLKKLNHAEDRAIAVIDQTGELYAALEEAVNARNASLETLVASEDKDEDGDDFGRMVIARIQLQKIEAPSVDDELRMRLSDQIREGELHAFVEIPADAIESEDGSPGAISYYSQDSGISDTRGWFQSSLNEIIKNLRLIQYGIDPARVTAASTRVDVRSMGLVEKSASGEIRVDEKDELSSIFLPMGVMMLMFMVIFLAAQPMLESVLEEKSQRIAEVLLGSVNSFQLMMGKLLGTVAGSLTVFGIYFLGAVLLAQNRGWTGMIPFHLVPWFVIFQILGVMFYASVFMAVGSSVTQLKEAQSMLLPVWMVMMLPFFVWFTVVREPNSTLSVALSFFPPATPAMMVLRLATGQTIPWWQPFAGAAVALIATLFVVFIASRIFRAGLLWQGNVPKISEIFRWALRG